ncbi:MAG: CpaF family protein [Alkaliphilus sp.]
MQEENLAIQEKKFIIDAVFNSIRRLDVLQPLIDDETITEIMVNGYESIFIERDGATTKLDVKFESQRKLEDVIQTIVSKVNRIVNESSPIVDARLSDGSRINVVLPPVALNGPILTIRKFKRDKITIQDLIEISSITEEVAEFLEDIVKAKYNIFVCGGTGSGKTTFLNILSNLIPKDERIITIEDSAELRIKGIQNLVTLETRNANTEGKGQISIRDLIKSSLRMRPDRIIVGEVRGEEAIDMLQAMNTGHDGSLSTGHSNSTKDMISRLETMVLSGTEMPIEAIRQQVGSAVDIIIHLSRIRDKTRKVLEISEVLLLGKDEIKINSLYVFEETGVKDKNKIAGKLVRTENRMKKIHKFKLAGIERMQSPRGR